MSLEMRCPGFQIAPCPRCGSESFCILRRFPRLERHVSDDDDDDQEQPLYQREQQREEPGAGHARSPRRRRALLG